MYYSGEWPEVLVRSLRNNDFVVFGSDLPKTNLLSENYENVIGSRAMLCWFCAPKTW